MAAVSKWAVRNEDFSSGNSRPNNLSDHLLRPLPRPVPTLLNMLPAGAIHWSAESQILFLTETLRVNLRCKWMKSPSLYTLPSWLAIDWLLYSHYSSKSSGKKPSIYVNGIKIIKCKSTLYPRSAVSERWFKFISAALNCPHSKKARTLWRRKKAAALVELALLTSQCLSNFIKLVQ